MAAERHSDSATACVHEWLLDTEASMDICSSGQRGVRSLLLTRAEPMATANGLITPEAKITVKLNALNEESECIEMSTAVRAISVGRRCQMHGYRFVWEPWALVPSFQTPEGEFVDVKSYCFVPHIFTSTALPQAVSTGLTGGPSIYSLYMGNPVVAGTVIMDKCSINAHPDEMPQLVVRIICGTQFSVRTQAPKNQKLPLFENALKKGIFIVLTILVCTSVVLTVKTVMSSTRAVGSPYNRFNWFPSIKVNKGSIDSFNREPHVGL